MAWLDFTGTANAQSPHQILQPVSLTGLELPLPLQVCGALHTSCTSSCSESCLACATSLNSAVRDAHGECLHPEMHAAWRLLRTQADISVVSEQLFSCSNYSQPLDAIRDCGFDCETILYATDSSFAFFKICSI